MPITTKAGPMPTHQRLRTDDGEDVQDRREPSVGKNQRSVFVRLARPLTLRRKNNLLMSEGRILRLKPALRLEWRSQDDQNKADQRDHYANLTDSLDRQRRR